MIARAGASRNCLCVSLSELGAEAISLNPECTNLSFACLRDKEFGGESSCSVYSCSCRIRDCQMCQVKKRKEVTLMHITIEKEVVAFCFM